MLLKSSFQTLVSKRMKPNLSTPKLYIILLWIVLLFNMLFADIFSIIIELEEGNILDIPMAPRRMMALASIINNIPIGMIFLTAVLPWKTHQWVNRIAALLTAVYIIGGGVDLPHYYSIATIEILCLLGIFRLSYSSAKS